MQEKEEHCCIRRKNLVKNSEVHLHLAIFYISKRILGAFHSFSRSS